ncbi:MAG: helix-turn-helix domain-containing protein [Halobacteriales archaeon]|nr:helix-turn-helix domain-containing protein [Halobacteriales archaeon]
MITASLRIELPEGYWVADVSRDFPDATYRLLSGVRTNETAVELGEVVADEPRAASDAVAEHPHVVEYQRLELGEDRSLAKYETTDTGLYDFVEDSSLPPEFPIEVRAGWYEIEFTGTRDEFDALRAGVEASGLRHELVSLVESGGDDAKENLLTERQREMLEAALREGYFEVPRDCTLEELADEIGVDKSTASGVLRRGEARVLKRFLTGVGGESR